jgi:Zn-dependent protease
VDFLRSIILIAPPILFAITVHEYAHGRMALRFGDPTAKYAGRLTLNPIAHIDPIGLIMLFLVHFGWAKPVPVNPYNLRDPKRDMIWVSLAGPASNLLTAFGCGLLFRFLAPFVSQVDLASIGGIIIYMLAFSVIINIALAFFNLIPIPPLDGSKILMGIAPPEYEGQIAQLERYGPLLLMGLIFVPYLLLRINLIWFFLRPFISIFSLIFAGIDLTRVL